MPEPATEVASKGEGTLVEGVVVGGKYRLQAELGVGAMGVVWSAAHTSLGHQVAIKFLLNSVMASDEARVRFEREAKLAARLGEASRHITRVIDHGVTDERVPYLVMEMLRGESLSARVKRERRLPLPLATRIVQQLARALHVAHSAGVVHRDLKPANVFLCNPEQGDEVEVKLLDFGVAKVTAVELEEEQNTGKGQVLGTPSYMSPEQISGDKPIDARTDLWAVAAIVYRMVVGRGPFGSGPVPEIALRIVSNEAAPPSHVWSDLPVELDMWMARGLAKNPDERFQSARDLADFLATVAGVTATGGAAARPSQNIPLEDTGASHGSSTGTQIHSAPPPSPKRNRLAVPLGIAGVALLVLVVVVLMARSSPQPATSTASAASPVAVPTATAPPASSASAPPIAVTVASVMPSATTSASSVPKKPAGKYKGPDGSGWGNKHEL